MLRFQSGLLRPCPRWPERNAPGHFFIFFSPAAARRLNIQRFCSCGERTRRSSAARGLKNCMSLHVCRWWSECIFSTFIFSHTDPRHMVIYFCYGTVCMCVCVLKMRSLLLRPTSNLCSLEEMEQERINREATRHPAPRRDADLHLLFLFPSLFVLLRAT